MANFILFLDPDPARRQAAALRARDQVAFVPRLRAELTLAPRYSLVWAAAPSAPVETHFAQRPDLTDCILFGEPHEDSGRTLRAIDLARRQDLMWDAPSDRNGFYAALMLHPHRGVRVEADVLGTLPIYYWQQGEVLLVATSPDLFRCHPLFHTQINLHGVAALLLTSGMVGGRTLWRNVRRLEPDHLLLCAPGEQARELAPPPPVQEAPLTSLDETVREASALHTAFLISALRSSRQPGLQLSGGLDSRLLAGFVTTLGHRPNCLTFGRPEDLDARCATQVARELDLPQTMCESDPADYATYAASCVRQENLAGGLYSLAMGWNISV
ncbi:MAG TPA: asparagine synthase-related protein, partial [Opitutus sp.]|nr:asparagine synthase-related protein [Opitutus sp.]